MTGTKEVCSTGDCGACSITMDGRLVCSCLVLAAETEDKNIETIEGMAKNGKYLDRISHHAAYKDMFKKIDKLLR